MDNQGIWRVDDQHGHRVPVLVLDRVLFLNQWMVSRRSRQSLFPETDASRYPYPLFDLLATWQRVLLFSGSAVVMTGSTMALKFAYSIVNGVQESKGDAVNPLKVE